MAVGIRASPTELVFAGRLGCEETCWQVVGTAEDRRSVTFPNVAGLSKACPAVARLATPVMTAGSAARPFSDFAQAIFVIRMAFNSDVFVRQEEPVCQRDGEFRCRQVGVVGTISRLSQAAEASHARI